MGKFQFLLLDAGPTIKLFQLGIWDKFVERYDVTITSTVAAEAKWASKEYTDIKIDLDAYRDRVKIIEQETSVASTFYTKLPTAYKDDVEVQDGEVHTLAFLCGSPKDWLLCSADHAVFRILGLIGKGEQGISLEEALKQIGLQPAISWDKITPRDEDWKYTKKFREQWTRKRQSDFVQGQGLV
jgi:hypothetical protein